MYWTICWQPLKQEKVLLKVVNNLYRIKDWKWSRQKKKIGNRKAEKRTAGQIKKDKRSKARTRIIEKESYREESEGARRY